MANNSISLVNLDFDTFKEQLKQYLRGQAQFSDYDFDGSNMSVLLDILSYNTHLNAFYLNMVASEMFLDSAQLRNSIISTAKLLNYTPRSTKSSRALLNLRFPQTGLQNFIVPAGTRFSGKNSRGTFQFLTQDSLSLTPTQGFFSANNVAIFEGARFQDTFIISDSIENQRFILSNNTIDTDSIRVTVTEDIGSTVTEFSRTISLYNITDQDDVFFVQATEDTRYEIFFGDGIIGRKPKNGAVVTVSYRNTSGEEGNQCTNFILNDNLGAVNGIGSAIIPEITVSSPSFGGGSAESTDEIKLRAPRYFQTQERAITTNDYQALITREFQYIKNLFVYGGDQASGVPAFGTVFIAPITFTGEFLSQNEKSEIEQFISDKTTLGIIPKVVNPDFLYVNVNTRVKAELSRTRFSLTELVARIKSTIIEYNTDELFNFNATFRTSRFETAVNAADASILSNTTDITIRKTFISETFQRTFPVINYRNSIVPGTIVSSPFTSAGRRFQYVDFNPNVTTFIVQQVENRTVITNTARVVYLKDITTPELTTYTPAGTVDYDTGSITLNSITISSFLNRTGLDIFAKPVNEDVIASENDVLLLDIEEGITVSVEQA